MSARQLLPQMQVFARRGFIAVGLMRRGYGSSAGGWAEAYGDCRTANYAAAGRAAAADLSAAITALSARSDVDRSKILAVGVSAGGFATLALTTNPPPGLVAAINFAGGRGSLTPDSVCSPEALIEAFRTFGARSRIPMLWVYARNDHFFSPDLVRRFLAAFEGAGGRVTFIDAPAFGTDGHALFSATGIPVWTPLVETFLDRQGFAHPEANQGEALGQPSLEPPASLGSAGRRAFQTYRDSANHKAFAIAPDGAFGWRTARPTVQQAADEAIKNCVGAAHHTCDLFAVDDGYAPRP